MTGTSHVTPLRTPSLILLSPFAGFGAVSGYRARGGRRAPLRGYQGSRASGNQMSPFRFKILLCFYKIFTGPRMPTGHINGMKHLKWISIFF